MQYKVSAFAPTSVSKLPEMDGVWISVGSVPNKNWGYERDDFVVFKFDNPTSVAGVYTRNKFAGPNIAQCRESLKSGKARALVVVSGIANVLNGEAGISDVNEIVNTIAQKFSCPTEQVFLFCTGSIGLLLPMDKIRNYMSNMPKFLKGSEQWARASDAFRTVDTFSKVVTRTITISGKEVVINCVTKGSGMIKPDMATTLTCIVTNANISSKLAQIALSDAVERSFHCICLDDTSTSDAMMLFATNLAGHDEIESETSPGYTDFLSAIREVTKEMAIMIAKDAEGIGKFITLNITGAQSFESARKIGKCIASSPLFKASISGGIRNIAKIATALGHCDEPIDVPKISVLCNGVFALKNGSICTEERDKFVSGDRIKDGEIEFIIDVGVGKCSATVWASDLTYGYIDINAGTSLI